MDMEMNKHSTKRKLNQPKFTWHAYELKLILYEKLTSAWINFTPTEKQANKLLVFIQIMFIDPWSQKE